MYIIGYVDDDKDSYDDYKVRLARKDINLLYPDNCSEKDSFLEWIILNNIKCLIVDYKLNRKFKFLGTDLVAYINVKMPDLPCLILTNFPEESIRENLVINNLIEERNVLAAQDIEGFVSKLKQSVNVFEHRLRKYTDEYEELLKLKSEGNISALRDERFMELYKLLRAYGEVDELPVQLLESQITKKIDEILGDIKELLDKAEER